jgi:hypothetical protein
MAVFDASKEWTILLPSDIEHAKKAAADLSRYIGLLANASKAPAIMDALGSAPEEDVIVLSSNGHAYDRNGFSWRAGIDRVEISGESDRGLCNGIYSFLAALGISWPAPGQEELPSQTNAAAKEDARLFPLASSDAFSFSEGVEQPLAAHLRRFVSEGKSEVKKLLKKSKAFVEWAARRRYDVLVFPLVAYASGRAGRKLEKLGKIAGEYGIVLEAGGRELSSLVPRRYFLFHRDYFRMDDGKRKKDHHFCPTNPGVTRLIAKESERLFRFAPEAAVIHLWPDKGAETAWCSCPTCRAFSSLEQNRIAINVAADALAALKRGADHEAFIFYFEKPGESGKIKPRKNAFSMNELP